jgi:hypothetical protein
MFKAGDRIRIIKTNACAKEGAIYTLSYHPVHGVCIPQEELKHKNPGATCTCSYNWEKIDDTVIIDGETYV